MADPRTLLVEERVRLPAHAEAIDGMHRALDRFWQALRSQGHEPDATWRLELASAVLEIGTNIVHHGSPLETTPTPITLRLRSYPDRVEACFLDRGVPFVEPAGDGGFTVVGDVPDDAVADLPESGYGLPIARRALDELGYRRSWHGTNFWHLVKRRRSTGRGGG